jgi:hypothetical protein
MEPQALSDDIIFSYYVGGCMEGCMSAYIIRYFPLTLSHAPGLPEPLDRRRRVRRGLRRVISDRHLRKTATEYDRKPGIKWFSCTEK